MVGMMQIMIWMLCVYLIFKGIEIYQIGRSGSPETRGGGKVLGVFMIVAALIAALVFFTLQEQMVEQIQRSQEGVPRLNS